MTKGYFSLVLHSHLPWVLGHGRWPHGTDWLNEATAECYVPLLSQIFQLIDEGYHPHLNIGITPILQEQLTAPHFVNEFTYYLKNTIDAAEQDCKEFSRKGQPTYLRIAKMWNEYYITIKETFENRFKRNVLRPFNALQRQGYVEIMTSAATHGYLPLLKHDRSVNAQIQCGVEVYKNHFHCPPRGIWLPECAYRPSYTWKPPVGSDTTAVLRRGVDEFVSKNNCEYFVVDSHLLKGGKAIGVYLSRFKALKDLWEQSRKEFIEIREDFAKNPQEVYLVSSNPRIKPVALLARDPTTALQVWSGELGYPGESRYLDFHKKKFPGGLRYWRVTDPKIDLALKEPYEPAVVEEKIREHAEHFVSLIKHTCLEHHKKTGKPALVCTPFDTELFGHWWFEGPRWIYYVLRSIEEDAELELITGSTILEKFEPDKIISLPEGSWGEGGFHYIWLNPMTEWTWERVYEAEDRFYTILDTHAASRNATIKRFLRQLARELLLLQSSDWQFLISTWSARDYAELRFSRHFDNFKQIASLLDTGRHDRSAINYVRDLEIQDSCFKTLDLTFFKT